MSSEWAVGSNASGYSLYNSMSYIFLSGSPYVTIIGPGETLLKNHSVSVTLQFPVASPVGFSGIIYTPFLYYDGSSP